VSGTESKLIDCNADLACSRTAHILNKATSRSLVIMDEYVRFVYHGCCPKLKVMA
jgi:hypothetical protein